MQRGRPSTHIVVGQKYNSLTAKRRIGQDKYGREVWECECDCGKTAEIKATYLRTGEKKSCGCLQFKGNRATHGHAAKQSRIYRIWKNMRTRCTNPNLANSQNYSGRGIRCDSRWESFENFLADMGEPPTEYFSLDRIDNNGNYTPDNCRWATRRTQRLNSRAPIHWIEMDGKRMSLADAVRKYSSVSYAVVKNRLVIGWSERDAILMPKQNKWSRRSKK